MIHSFGWLVLLAATSAGVSAQVLCSDFQETLDLSDQLVMEYTVFTPEGASEEYLKARVTYDGLGYVSIGFASAPGGGMIGARAVIGVSPDEPALMYDMNSYATAGVTIRPDNFQVANATLTATDSQTVLEFMMPVVDDQEGGIVLATDAQTLNGMMYAIGSSYSLGYHTGRETFNLALEPCVAPVAEVETSTPTDTPVAAETLPPTPTISTSLPALSATCTNYQSGMELATRVGAQLSMDYTVYVPSDNDEALFKVRLTYSHPGGTPGWVAFGFPTDEAGLMVGATAVIGLPDEDDINYWIMNSYSQSDVVLLEGDDVQDQIQDATVTQTADQTILEFVKPVIGVGDDVTLAIDGETLNTFIWAIGGSNSFGYHSDRGTFTATLNLCEEATAAPTSMPTSVLLDSESIIPTMTPAPSVATTMSPTTLPTIPPSEIPTTNPPTSLPTTTQTLVSTGDCRDFQTKSTIPTNNGGNLEMEYTIYDSGEDGLFFRTRLTFDSADGYLSLGFPKDSRGLMTDAVSVIGLPGSEVMYWKLDGYSVSSVTPLEDADVQGQIQNATVVQSDGLTILEFTKPVEGVDDGITLVTDGETPNYFIWAVGGSNSLSYHRDRGAFDILLSICTQPTAGGPVEGTVEAVAVPYEEYWLAHGFLAFLAWGVCAPLAIASSILRNGFSVGKPLWIKIHKYANELCVALTVVSVLIGVAAFQLADTRHFMSGHEFFGIIILVLALVQAVGGLFRPHLPHKHQPEPDEDEDDDEEKKDKNQPVGAPVLSDDEPHHEEEKKSLIRRVWEIKHRVLGFFLLFGSWFQISTGLDEFGTKYNPGNTDITRLVFLGYVVVMVIAVVLLRMCIHRQPS